MPDLLNTPLQPSSLLTVKLPTPLGFSSKPLFAVLARSESCVREPETHLFPFFSDCWLTQSFYGGDHERPRQGMGGPDGASKSLDFNESTFLAIKKIEWREGLLMLQAFEGLSTCLRWLDPSYAADVLRRSVITSFSQDKRHRTKYPH